MMGSNFLGKMNTGSSSPSSSSSSSRRSRRGNLEKPKQPQRGLGVAQLEKIRLHEEMGCCFNLPSSKFIHGDPRIMAAHPSSLEPWSPSSPSWPLSSPASAYNFQHNFMKGPTENGATDIISRDSQPITATSWRPDNIGMPERFQFSHPSMDNERLLHLRPEDPREMRSRTPLMTGRSSLTISSSKDSGSSETDEDVDLELRL